MIQIAIDGPSGAGKSTVAKELAKKLNIMYLDTGAMYRAITYSALMNRITPDNKEQLSAMLDDFNLKFENTRIYLDDEDITEVIRTADVESKVSDYASVPFVRSKMVEMQKKLAQNKDVVMEGRDIGSVVLKESPYKFYLDADLETRTKRRYDQMKSKRADLTIETLKKELSTRDQKDSQRESDPLSVAKGSIVIDTTDMTMEEVIDQIVQYIQLGA